MESLLEFQMARTPACWMLGFRSSGGLFLFAAVTPSVAGSCGQEP